MKTLRQFAFLFLVGIIFPLSDGYSLLDTKTSIPEFDPNLQWTQSKRVQLKDLEGKVTLIYFWNLGHFESVDHLDFLNHAADVLSTYGFKIVTIHVPEYDFDKSPQVISAFLDKYGITIPVALDNQFLMRSRYQNLSVPAFYLIDRQGKIRKNLSTSYSYEKILSSLKGLLEDDPNIQVPELRDQFKKFNMTTGLSPDYVTGSRKLSGFGNVERIAFRADRIYTLPENLNEQVFYLKGPWYFEADFVKSLDSESSLFLKTKNRTITITAESVEKRSIKAEIFFDGNPLSKEMAGVDVNSNGKTAILKIDHGQVYHILNLPSSLPVSGVLQIKFESPVKIYRISDNHIPYLLQPVKKSDQEQTEDENLDILLESEYQ